MIRSYRYRLYPNRAQTAALAEMLDAYRELWNAALQERRDAWRLNGISINYYDQANQLREIRVIRPDLARFNYSASQQLLRRLDKAFKAFFRRMKAGEKPGYPRFRSRSRFRSVEYRFGDGATIRDGRLHIQGVGPVKVKWHRPVPDNATIKAVVVKQDSAGDWHAVFQLEMPDSQPAAHPGPAVGVDLGVTNLAALSTGELIATPRHFRKTERKLRRQQRRLSRRKKFSRRWHKARKRVAGTHNRIANQRRDFSHKLSRRLVTGFSLVAVEKLTINGLARSRLAKSIHDAGWSQLLMHLSYKAEEAGSTVISVDPYNTSQACSGCGCLVPKALSVRVHWCPEYGLTLDRDVNAALNILHRALNPPGRGGQSVTQRVAARVL